MDWGSGSNWYCLDASTHHTFNFHPLRKDNASVVNQLHAVQKTNFKVLLCLVFESNYHAEHVINYLVRGQA